LGENNNSTIVHRNSVKLEELKANLDVYVSQFEEATKEKISEQVFDSFKRGVTGQDLTYNQVNNLLKEINKLCDTQWWNKDGKYDMVDANPVLSHVTKTYQITREELIEAYIPQEIAEDLKSTVDKLAAFALGDTDRLDLEVSI